MTDGFVCNSRGSEFSPRKMLYFSTPSGLHFVRFLKKIFGYTAFTLYCRWTESSVKAFFNTMDCGEFAPLGPFLCPTTEEKI
jgi:hypothetical protein